MEFELFSLVAWHFLFNSWVLSVISMCVDVNPCFVTILEFHLLNTKMAENAFWNALLCFVLFVNVRLNLVTVLIRIYKAEKQHRCHWAQCSYRAC